MLLGYKISKMVVASFPKPPEVGERFTFNIACLLSLLFNNAFLFNHEVSCSRVSRLALSPNHPIT